MNNLVLKQEIEEVTLNSREIAEMLGKRHTDLLRELDGSSDGKTIGIIPTLENANFALSKYFIPSTYKSGTREYKCYEITKMGCHMLGNKLQGEKGILFTAKYVERFNEMEKNYLVDKHKKK
ncbi:Rha family transcriptional regulator [Clostridium perfringens]|nr:Rha family transcriptional regulator [Clostridium perfringens]